MHARTRSSGRGRVEAWLHRWCRRGSEWADRRGPLARFGFELVVFGVKQAWACVFGAALLALIIATHFFYPEAASLARYDFLVLAALGLQLALLALRMETPAEARVILVFHLVGTAMEVFKTSVGSWTYPEPSVLRVAGVPLFSGFMYASVGSYIARVWRLFDFRFSRRPRLEWMAVLAGLIYLNFFSHHFIVDGRWLLLTGIAILYCRTWVHYRIDTVHRSMPLLLGFALVSLFIWAAENLGTFARAWSYPSQALEWQWVGLGKLGSWFLLMNISFVLVAALHRPGARSEAANRIEFGKWRDRRPGCVSAAKAE